MSQRGAVAELAFLWHMHQPPYRDPGTGIYVLPWVRLHATRGYLDMAEIHRRYPEVRATVNFSGVLLEQLADYAAGTARDRFLELSRKPAADLEEEERRALLEGFFMVSWERGIQPLPRYWELLQKRGLDWGKVDPVGAVRSFTEAELRDLQVLFNLAWMGFAAREQSDVVRGLLEKGRDFREEEKEALLDEQQELVASVLPRWRDVALGGRVELSVTAHYHPILPLLCDSDSSARALPSFERPPRLLAADDAAAQVRLGQEAAMRAFGHRTEGMWPAEGSVSPEALEVFVAEGVKWLASDEEVLRRSLPPDADRLETLFRPWRVRAGASEVSMVFRDRGLSDLIGFTYARSLAHEAVNDFLGHVERIGRSAPVVEGGPPLVSVILDGENPWEYYADSGRDFLHELYGRLSAREGGIATTSIGRRLEGPLPPGRIERIHSGSWIEGNFRIWMGHPEKVQAWALVKEAKTAWARAPDAAREAAYDDLLAAEASDWFWWFGEDFATESRADFDHLFRSHIQSVFTKLGKDPPAASLSPIARLHPEEEAFHQPIGFVRPRIDGRVSSFQEWLGAGIYRLEARREQAAMHRGAGVFASLHYGFDPQHLYLRLDPVVELPGQLARTLKEMDEIRVLVQQGEEELSLLGSWTDGEVILHRDGREAGHGAVDEVVELRLPLASLGLEAGQRIGVAVSCRRGGVEVERIPSRAFVPLEVAGEDFEQVVWKV